MKLKSDLSLHDFIWRAVYFVVGYFLKEVKLNTQIEIMHKTTTQRFKYLTDKILFCVYDFFCQRRSFIVGHNSVEMY